MLHYQSWQETSHTEPAAPGIHEGVNTMIQNTHYVNNTPSDIRMVFPLLKQAYVTGLLPEELEDLFTSCSSRSHPGCLHSAQQPGRFPLSL